MFTATLLDPDGTAITAPTAMTLTLTNARTGAVINGRNSQNILDTNNVTHNASTGVVIWEIQADDTSMVDSSQSWEDHVATFTWIYDGGKIGKHVHRLHCVNYLMLCTFEDVKMLLDNIPDEDEPMVEYLIESFSLRAEDETHRRFRKSTASVPTVQTFSPKGNTNRLVLERFPVDSVTSVIEDGEGDFSGSGAITWETDDYAVIEELGLIKARYTNFTAGQKNYQVTYAGGIALDVGAVPMDLRVAASKQVGYMYQRRQQRGIQEVAISQYGREEFNHDLDLLPDVKAVLRNYRPVYI